jgi:hypothetical protein
MGLATALKAFDASAGYALSSFAVPHIKGAIQHHLRDRAIQSQGINRTIWDIKSRVLAEYKAIGQPSGMIDFVAMAMRRSGSKHTLDTDLYNDLAQLYRDTLTRCPTANPIVLALNYRQGTDFSLSGDRWLEMKSVQAEALPLEEGRNAAELTEDPWLENALQMISLEMSDAVFAVYLERSKTVSIEAAIERFAKRKGRSVDEVHTLLTLSLDSIRDFRRA